MASNMSSAEIIAFKKRFRADPELGSLACRLIAADMALQLLDTPDDDDCGAKVLHGMNTSFQTDDTERIAFVEGVTENWLACLNSALDLPGDEWPKNMVDPEVYLEPLQELNTAMRTTD